MFRCDFSNTALNDESKKLRVAPDISHVLFTLCAQVNAIIVANHATFTRCMATRRQARTPLTTSVAITCNFSTKEALILSQNTHSFDHFSTLDILSPVNHISPSHIFPSLVLDHTQNINTHPSAAPHNVVTNP